MSCLVGLHRSSFYGRVSFRVSSTRAIPEVLNKLVKRSEAVASDANKEAALDFKTKVTTGSVYTLHCINFGANAPEKFYGECFARDGPQTP